MESSSSSLTSSDFLFLYFLRPILAISFVFSLLFLGWFLAWKLVLVHVPLVQEIFGLRKKTVIPKPPSRRRLSRFYNSLNSRNSDSLWSLCIRNGSGLEEQIKLDKRELQENK